MPKPLVSIIIPNYKIVHFIEETNTNCKLTDDNTIILSVYFKTTDCVFHD